MNRLLAAAAALAATTALLAPSAATATVDTVDLSRPGSLERGDDLRIPYLEGRTIVDGDTRVEVSGAVTLLGTSGGDFVVLVRRDRAPHSRVVRVTADGESTQLLRGQQAQAAQLSDDGAHLVSSDWERRTRLTAYDATDGDEIASRVFRVYPEVLDVDAGSVLVAAWNPRQRTVVWDLTTDTRSLVVDKIGYQGDLSADRLAVLIGDPYRNGRSRVVALSDPDTAIWESRRQRIYAFSPEGDLAATVHILADGLGPTEVHLREIDGTLLTAYEAPWFGRVAWEDADTLLLDAHGTRTWATVRCDGAVCERASTLRRSQP